MHAAIGALVLLAAMAPAAASAAPQGTTGTAAPAAAAAAGADPSAAATTAKAAKNAYSSIPDRLTLPGNVDRTLAGHVFTPSFLIRPPFAVTEVGADLLYGTGTADGNKPAIIDGNRGTTTYEFAAMGQNFYYDAKVADGVSVGGGLTVQLFSGITGPSAVVLGLEVGYGLFGRVTAGSTYGPVRAAFTFDAAYTPRYGIFLLNALEVVSNNDGSVTESAFAAGNAWTMKPGVSLAYAPHPSVGIMGNLDYQGVWFDSSSGWKWQSGLDAGIAADLDFGTFTTTPVAAVAAFRATVPLGSDGVSTVINYTVGAFYTGRPPLVVGAELGQQRFTYRGLDAVANIIQIRVQYLW